MHPLEPTHAFGLSCRYVDNLPPGQAMPYAWDEPTQRNLIRVQVGWAGRQAGMPR